MWFSKSDGGRLGFGGLDMLPIKILPIQSVQEMDIIYSKFSELVEQHKLLINKAKTKCFLFSSKKNRNAANIIHLGNDNLEVVQTFKYLGHHLSTENLVDKEDINCRLKSFYASFNSIKRDFPYVNLETMLFLFQCYCKPDYGLALWNNCKSTKSKIFKTFNVAYNKAMKNMLDAPMYSSSHEAASACKLLLLDHHVSFIQCRYAKRIENSSNCIIKSNMSFLKSGYFFTNIYKCMKERYSINIMHEDIDVINSRINWVQNHEDRRNAIF